MAKEIIIKGVTDVEYIPFEGVGDDKSDLRDVRQLQVGFGSKVFRIDRDGMWAGAERFADAPWSVDWDGNMVATSLDLSGYLQVGEALTDIGLGNITGTYIASGAITTAKLSATAIDGMTITGALIRTSSSGARVIMDDSIDALRIYDATRERMRLDGDSLIFYDGAGDVTGTFGALYSNIIAVVFPSTELGFVVYSDTTAKFAVGNNEVVVYDDLLAGGAGINLGSTSEPFEDLFVDDIRPTAQSSNPTSNGMMRYYVNGGTEGLRMQFGGSDFQFDATGV